MEFLIDIDRTSCIQRIYLYLSPLIVLKLLESAGRPIGTAAIPPAPPISVGPRTQEDPLVSSSSPANLLGRDLLCKYNATIKCQKKGIFISQAKSCFLLPFPEIHLDLNSSEEGETLKDVPISL